MEAILCNDLCREYVNKKKQARTVLDHFTLSVNKGEIYGILGPNGAGKTTLIKILSTLLNPSQGEAYICGYHVTKQPQKVRENIGVLLSNNRALYLKLSAYENLHFFAELYHIPLAEQKKRIEKVLKLVGLWERKDEYTEKFSHGMLQRLNIARAILTEPPVLILDEPTNGLDIESVSTLHQLILEMNSSFRTTVLLTSHNISDLELLSHRLMVIKNGKSVLEGTPQNLKEHLCKAIYEIEITEKLFPENYEKLNLLFPGRLRVERNTNNGKILTFSSNQEMEMQDLFALFLQKKIECIDIKKRQTTLEDVYLEIMRGEKINEEI